ncbi:MAG TPA: hypothetical protein VFD58_28360 [Blastocatellia bacterium]|nr:hypothetical protein [Blastocatellia bacterium]
MSKKTQGISKREELENLSLNQGYIREEDLESGSGDAQVMPPREIDSYAQKAESAKRKKGGGLKGEGDYEAAEDYNTEATDFARKQSGR